MPIHDSTRGYETGARDYVAGRPDYPSEAIAWLRDVLGVGPGRKTLEIGAGTGKFLPNLLACGGDIVALEPVGGMREQLMRGFPDIDVLAGTAEAIPLPDASVHSIVCAQAFHWFATDAAVQEMHRVLVPGGMLGLIWNVRDESVPWVAELSTMIDGLEGDTPRYRTGAWRKVFPAPGFAFAGQRQARNAHIGSAEQVIIKRTLSVSFVAALPRERQQEVERRVRAFIADTPALAGQAEIAFPYETCMFAYRKL